MNTVLAGIMILSIAACESPNIKDSILNDRVKACSAGFSEETQVALNASLNKAKLSGGLSGEAKDETRSVIFSQLPDGDKLKAYEDYIGCIEKNWNGSE